MFGGPAVALTVQAGRRYSARVAAVNAVGQGDWSNFASLLAASPPGAPTAVGAQVSGPLSANVSWQAPKDRGLGSGVSYNISAYGVMCTPSGAVGVASAEVGGGESSTVVTGLVKGVVYQCTAR